MTIAPASAQVAFTTDEAPSSCPTRIDLAARVAVLLGRNPFVDGLDSPRLDVRFLEGAEGFTADVTLNGSRAFRGSRTIRQAHRQCATLEEPLAFVIAMAVEAAEANLAHAGARRIPVTQEPSRRAELETARVVFRPTPAETPWRLALGPGFATHLFDGPGLSLGGTLDLRLSRNGFAWMFGTRVSRALGEGGVAATTWMVEAHGCVIDGPVDLCVGLAGGLQRFDGEGLTPLRSAAIVGHIAPVFSVATHVDLANVAIRPAVEVGFPLWPRRVSTDSALVFDAPGFSVGVRLALLFGLSEPR